jgi:hypothetical protein
LFFRCWFVLWWSLLLYLIELLMALWFVCVCVFVFRMHLKRVVCCTRRRFISLVALSVSIYVLITLWGG